MDLKVAGQQLIRTEIGQPYPKILVAVINSIGDYTNFSDLFL